MRKIIFSLMALFCMAEGAQAQSLSVADVQAKPGETVSFTLTLNIPDGQAWTGFQSNVTLPEGITLTKKNSTVNEAWDGSFSIGASKISGVSMSLDVMPTGEFELGTIELKVAEEAVEKDYTVTLTDFELLSGSDRKALEDVSFTVKVANVVVIDENATAAPEAATGVNVSVKRTIKAGEWSTIVLPFAMTEAQVKAAFGDDVALGDFTGYDFDEEADKISVNFQDVTAIEANHPYIIKVSADVTEFSAEGVNIEAEEDPCVEFDNGQTGRKRVVLSGFYGTYTAGAAVEEACFFLSGGKFWYTESGTAMKGLRAYFYFSDELQSYAAAARMSIAFGETTGVSDVNRVTTNYNIYHTLGGQSVEKPAKGLYIQNGKKVIIK